MRLSRTTSPRPAEGPTPAGEVSASAVCDPEGVTGPASTAPDGAVEPQAAAAPAAEGWVAPTWEQVVRDHSARVYRLAYRLSGTHQVAEDLPPDTFVRLCGSLADFSPCPFEG